MYCSFPGFRFLAVSGLFAAAACLTSCAKPATSWRIAILRFENLQPAEDSDWVGRAISEEIAGQLEGTRHNAVISFGTLHRLDAALGARPIAAPGVSAERPAAIGAGADRILTGFYARRRNQITITAVEENLETRLAGSPITVSGTVDDLLHLTDEIAHDIDEEATPPITGSARALRSYALAVESPVPQATPLLNEAIQLDPDFGRPYVALAEDALAQHDPAGFEKIFAAVRARGNGVRAVDRAILNLDQARLSADLPTRIDAIAALVRLMPADPFRLRELGAAELEANRYVEAADHFRKLTLLLPTSADPLNLLGYAQMYGGDEASARKSLEAALRNNPGDANAIDSLGDVSFFFGRFDAAEKFYLQSYGRDPAMADGAGLLKAAWARLMRDDRSGATALVERYSADRAQRQDLSAPLRAAQVLRVIGNRPQADALLANFSASAPATVQQNARVQAAWWLFLDHAGPAPEANAPSAQALIAIAQKNMQAAVPIWRKLAETAPPQEWWTRAVYARLLAETGQTQESARYRKFTPVPQPARLLNFDELWFPWIVSARHQASGSVE